MYCHIKLNVHGQMYTKVYFQITPPLSPSTVNMWTHVLCTNAHVYLYVRAQTHTCTYMYVRKRTCVPLCTWAHGSCSIKRAFLAMAAKRGRRKSERGRSLQLQDLINFKFILSSTWSCFRWSNIKSCFLQLFVYFFPYIITPDYIYMFLVGSEYIYSLLIIIYLSLFWSYTCS